IPKTTNKNRATQGIGEPPNPSKVPTTASIENHQILSTTVNAPYA
ncbi:uncharacterized protein METZ01_LOCUS266242, partial [marine metagenome]